MKYIRNKLKKGFTLIELLAVIVILAIIALIATPRIMAAIEQARKEAFRNDVYGIVKAVERDYVKRILDEEKVGVTYEFEDYVQTVTPEHIDELAFTGSGPKNGTIVVDEDGNIDLALDDDNWCCKLGEDGEVILKDINEGPCEIGSAYAPSGGSWVFEVTTTEENELFAFTVADVFDPNLTVVWGDGNDTTLEGYEVDYNGFEEEVLSIYRDFALLFSWYSPYDEGNPDLLMDLFIFTYFKTNHYDVYLKYDNPDLYDIWFDDVFIDIYNDVYNGDIIISNELENDSYLDELYGYVLDHIPIADETVNGIIVENNYEEPGVYEVTVSGVSKHLSFCAVDHAFFWYDYCHDTTPLLLSDILTPIPAEFGLTSANAMFAYTNVESFTASDFFDEASSNITDMNYMFSIAEIFNADISNWDTSNVESMNEMFNWAGNFNQDLNNWDTSNVKSMYGTFLGTTEFRGDISSWDVSNVENMYKMFYMSSNFNSDISGWNVGNVVNMEDMFMEAREFNQNISSWDTSNVTSMRRMFRAANSFNQDLSGWCVSLIDSTPHSFDQQADSWVLPRPSWGTCP